jgi:hypothetical protein
MCGNNNNNNNETITAYGEVQLELTKKPKFQIIFLFSLFILIVSWKGVYYEKKQMLKEEVGKTSKFAECKNQMLREKIIIFLSDPWTC